MLRFDQKFVYEACGIVAGLYFLAGCNPVNPAQAADMPAQRAVAVRLVHVERGPLARPIRAAGCLQLKTELDLSFKLPGVVTKVTVESGARVRKGQLLAAIDPTEANALGAQSAANLAKAERDLARARALSERDAIGKMEVQNAETSVVLARATLQSAQHNQRFVALLAPESGVIEKRFVEVGEVVAPGRPAFHMRGLSRGMVVRANVTDRDVLALSLGESARVRLDARPEFELEGRVARIASSASPGTGTFEIEVLLDEGPALMLPSGLTAKIEIARVEHTLAHLPLGALVEGNGDAAAVYVVDGERAKRVPVHIRFLADDRAALASGLENVDRVIELGAGQLTDGALVRVMN
jgi:RND family efflux transporter MFP subunit